MQFTGLNTKVSNALNVAETSFNGPVNTVVNCAGIGIATRTYHPKKGPHSLEEFERVIKVRRGWAGVHIVFYANYLFGFVRGLCVCCVCVCVCIYFYIYIYLYICVCAHVCVCVCVCVLLCCVCVCLCVCVCVCVCVCCCVVWVFARERFSTR